MDWPEAVDLVVAHTRHEAYRANCADDHPHREMWRRRMVEKAAKLEGQPVPEYPPFSRQVANVAGAVGRVVAAAARGERVLAPPEEAARRLAICLDCEHNGARPPAVHCKLCGCGGAKLGLATERCPIGRWEAVPPPSITTTTPDLTRQPTEEN